MSIPELQPTDKPEEPEGGAAWEVRTAADMLTKATGNPEVGTAMHRAIEGTVNATIAAMAPSYTATFSGVLQNTLREALQDVRAQLTRNGDTTAAVAQALALIDTRLTQRERADLDWRTQWRLEDDARRDAVHLELDQILSEVGGLKLQNTQLQEGFSAFGETLDHVVSRQDEQAIILAQVIAAQTDMDARQSAIEKQVATNGGLIAELRENDKAKFKQFETINTRIDALTKVQAAAQERQREIEDRAAVGVMSGEERARLMRWFQENAGKLQALIDAQEQQGDG